MRRAIPAALLVPLLLPASALDASGPDLRIVSAPAVSLRDAPRTAGVRVARLALGAIVTELATLRTLDRAGEAGGFRGRGEPTVLARADASGGRQ